MNDMLKDLIKRCEAQQDIIVAAKKAIDDMKWLNDVTELMGLPAHIGDIVDAQASWVDCGVYLTSKHKIESAELAMTVLPNGDFTTCVQFNTLTLKQNGDVSKVSGYLKWVPDSKPKVVPESKAVEQVHSDDECDF